MKTAEIMTSAVVTVRPSTPVSEIARLMVQNNISGLPVVDEAGRLLGMVTERDVIARHARVHFPAYLPLLESVVILGNTRHFREELRRALAATAAELMSTSVPVVSPETDILDVASIMFDQQANPIPVVANERLVGIISRTDLIRLMAQEEGPGAEQSAQ